VNNYYNALSEVSVILQHLELKELKKIPREIVTKIESNKSLEYNYIIDNNKKLEEQDILPETKAILANLYRDYIATDDRKETIKKKERVQILEIEERKRKLYNPDNIFKDKQILEKNEDIKLIVKDEKKETFIIKIFKFIRNILKKSN
jgi:hypothetical protein